MFEKHIIKCYELQQQFDDLYIGGSWALIAQNSIPYREPHDIDLITKSKRRLFNIFPEIPAARFPRLHIYEDKTYELFNNPNAEYVIVEYQGYNLKFSIVDEVLEWKRKRAHREKHFNDLNNLTLT